MCDFFAPENMTSPVSCLKALTEANAVSCVELRDETGCGPTPSHNQATEAGSRAEMDWWMG